MFKTSTVRRSRSISWALALVACLCSLGLAVAIPAGAASKSALPRSTKPKPPTRKQTQTELQRLATAAGTETKATFDLTYAYKNGTTSGSVTLEQKPPDEAFITGAAEILYNGKKTYYCSHVASQTTCFSYGSTTASPLGATMRIYQGSTYITAMKAWESELGAGITGYRASFSSAKFAGQSAQCVTWNYKSESAKYCVTNGGILAFVGSTSNGRSFSFYLTKISTSVTSSSFSPPPGAKLYSVP